MTSSNELSAAWFPPNLDADVSTDRHPARPSDSRTTDGEWVFPELVGFGEGADRRDSEDPSDLTEVDESYDRGYADGLRDGMEKAAEEIGPATEAVRKAAQALESMKGEFLRDVEGCIHALAIAVARKLVQREVSVDPSITKDLVNRGLELLPLDASIEIRLHPDDLAQLGQEFAKPASQAKGSTIQCVEDPSLERGSFFLESPFRLIDGRADHALRNFYERLQHE